MNFFRQLYSMFVKARFSSKMKTGRRCFFGSHFSIKRGNGNITIGNDCFLDCIIYTIEDGVVNIGSNTSIRYNSRIGAIQKVSIGDNVIISNHVTIMDNNNHPVHPGDRLKMIGSGYGSDLWKWKYAEAAHVVIHDNVWIGERARINKGVVIGAGSIVAAESVVTKNVPPNCIVAGNPAVVVKEDIHLGSTIINE